MAVRELYYEEEDPLAKVCKEFSGEKVSYNECKLPSGVKIFYRYVPILDRQYFEVVYLKDYNQDLGDLISDAVEKQTGGVCFVASNVEYGEYLGGSYLSCKERVDVSESSVERLKRMEKRVLESGRKAEMVIEDIKRMIKEKYL